MIVVDTHVWIWAVSDPEKLSRAAARALKTEASIGVPAISCWEVAMLAAKGRIGLDRGPLEWIEDALAAPFELLSLSPAIAVRATQLGHAFHGDPADRLIVATALVGGAPLVTKDQNIRAYGAATTIW